MPVAEIQVKSNSPSPSPSSNSDTRTGDFPIHYSPLLHRPSPTLSQRTGIKSPRTKLVRRSPISTIDSLSDQRLHNHHSSGRLPLHPPTSMLPELAVDSNPEAYQVVVSTRPFLEIVRVVWWSANGGFSAIDVVVDRCSTCEELRFDGTAKSRITFNTPSKGCMQFQGPVTFPDIPNIFIFIAPA